MSNDTRKDRTKLQLRDAMIQLLGEKSFDQISTTELVKLAKVSRSSFYTHYQDKYDMIEAPCRGPGRRARWPAGP